MQHEASTNLQVAERIARMLADSRIPVLVIGAVALAAHRYVRFTEDIDLGVIADLAHMRDLVESLRAEGFHVSFHEPDGDDPLGGVIDVSGPFGLIQIIRFQVVHRIQPTKRTTASGEDGRHDPDGPGPPAR